MRIAVFVAIALTSLCMVAGTDPYFVCAFFVACGCFVGIFLARTFGDKFPLLYTLVLTAAALPISGYVYDANWEPCFWERCGTVVPRDRLEDAEMRVRVIERERERIRDGLKPDQAPISDYGKIRTFDNLQVAALLRRDHLAKYRDRLEKDLVSQNKVLAQVRDEDRRSVASRTWTGVQQNLVWQIFLLWSLGYLTATGLGALGNLGIQKFRARKQGSG